MLLNILPKGPPDNKSALTQVITLVRTGDKPVPELSVMMMNKIEV